MNVPDRPIYLLIKICRKKEYADCFLSGKLYANRLRYFRDQGIDKYEGAIWLQPDKCLFTLHGCLIPAEDFARPIQAQLQRIDNLHIFCIFAFHHSVGFETLSPENVDDFKANQLGSMDACRKDFGAHAVVITNAQEFFNRVDAALKRMWQEKRILRSPRCLVEYYDPDTFHMEISKIPFYKRNEFIHQKEYRIAINTGTVGCDPLVLDIGNIRDIAFGMDTADIYSTTNIRFT